jgi:hypothetical protein
MAHHRRHHGIYAPRPDAMQGLSPSRPRVRKGRQETMRLGRALRDKPLMLHSPSYEVKPDPGAPGLDCVEHLNPFGGAPRERGNQSEING